MLAVRKVTIIGVASGQGARDRGCEDGPDALMASGPVQCLVDHSAAPTPFEILRPQSTASLFNVLPSIIEINQRLAPHRRAASVVQILSGGDRRRSFLRRRYVEWCARRYAFAGFAGFVVGGCAHG